MKSFSRKFIALLTCIVLSCTFVSTAFAANSFWVNPDNGKTYYVKEDGTIIKSKFVWVGEDLYYFDWKDGAMFTNGWCRLDQLNTQGPNNPSKWYYFNSNGKAVHDTVFRDPAKPYDMYIFDGYYMDDTPGYRQFKGKTYYCTPGGYGNLLLNQWLEETGGSRYFKNDGTMAVNEVIMFPNREVGVFDSNGYLIR